ncbi:MAG: hypothetical protein IJH50_10675 [Kiritimatiellae bacterium]|nr:hypothetical protein [Kiritimatiellia bacterium]
MKKTSTFATAVLCTAFAAQGAGSAPYVVTDGTYGIDTGCYPTDNTRLELDYAIAEARPSGAAGWYLFCGRSAFSAGVNNDGLFFEVIGGFKGGILKSSSNVVGSRLTVVLDNPASSCSVVKDGVTNYTATISHSSFAQDRTIKLASYDNMAGNFAKIRIYGCRIYESDALAHDFRPYAIGPAQDGTSTIVLMDMVTGALLTPSDGNSFSCGGTFPTLPPYVETLRSEQRCIDTGYTVTSASKVELDYSVAAARGYSDTWYLFIGGLDYSPNSTFAAYMNSSGLGFINSQTWKTVGEKTLIDAVNIRRTVVLDNPAGLGAVITAGATNLTCATAASGTYDRTLKLAGNYNGWANWATIRIYRCRISEKEGNEYVIKHDLVPAVKDGVVGLQDIIAGGALKVCTGSEKSPLTYGGVFDATVTQSAQKLFHGETATLTASATGAASYRWLRNGEPIEGGTSGTLTVPWRKGGVTDSYQAVAVYAVSTATSESAASEMLTIENVPNGMIISIK